MPSRATLEELRALAPVSRPLDFLLQEEQGADGALLAIALLRATPEQTKALSLLSRGFGADELPHQEGWVACLLDLQAYEPLDLVRTDERLDAPAP